MLDSKMRDLIIIGAGGFGAEASWVAREMSGVRHPAQPPASGWNLVGFADSDEGKRQTLHAGFLVHGTIEQAAEAFTGREVWFFCAVGNNAARRRLVSQAESLGWKPASLVHPSALIADTASVLAGTYVGPGSIVSNNARVGPHVIVTMHVSVGHDVVVGDYCQLSPGSRISGFCRIEELASLGSNSVLMPGTRVGRGALVGACSLAHGEVTADTTVCGVPARMIRVSPPADCVPQTSPAPLLRPFHGQSN